MVEHAMVKCNAFKSMFYFFKFQYLWLDIAGVLKAFAVCLGSTVTRSADLCLSMYLLLCVAVILNTPGVFPLCGIISLTLWC